MQIAKKIRCKKNKSAKSIFTVVLRVAPKLLHRISKRLKHNLPIIKQYRIHTERKEGIMTAKAKIKVIKKSDITNAEKPVVVKKETAQASAREMVSNVTNWVNDFQQRRREETKQAIEKFFSQQPQTSV